MLAAAVITMGCAAQSEYVKVSPEGNFTLGDSLYSYVGTNMWYGPILASPTDAGDMERLERELDTLQAMGVENLRVLAGADAPADAPSHASPVLQKAPGVYDEGMLMGLDRFLAELEKRGMKAVVYINNAWEWSGGYGSYLQWTGHGTPPDPTLDGYKQYVNFVKDFVLSPEATEMSINHMRNIVGRVNSVTGKPYSESPAIMSWQICNEPRAFSQEGKEALLRYIDRASQAIRAIDKNHLISTGSEGSFGCEVDIDLWKRIHSLPTVDYATIHIWPFNWQWVTEPALTTGAQQAVDYAMEYATEHIDTIAPLKKPLVIEEFGYPRTRQSLRGGDDAAGRDIFYKAILSLVEDGKVAGANFWGWGGEAQPDSDKWTPGRPYVTDPPHERQGWYSVFNADTTTVKIIKDAAKKAKKLKN